MTNLNITYHAEIRLNQRGFRKSDLNVILFFGTEIGRDRIMLMKQDAAREIEDLKKRKRKNGRGQLENVANGIENLKIADFERLSGKVLVFSDNHIVTAYPQVGRVQKGRRNVRYPRRRRLP